MKKKIFKSTISNLGTKRKREKLKNKSKKIIQIQTQIILKGANQII